MPKSMEALIMLRELMAKKIGLKTAEGRKSILKELEEFDGNVGSKIGLFEVVERSEDKLITGQNDTHLDFRLLFLVERGNPQKITLTTEVITHNLLGNIYFLFVMPMHKLIMPWVLKRMKRRLEQERVMDLSDHAI